MDLTLSERFSCGLLEQLREAIRTLPERELPVGRAVAIATLDRKIPWLIGPPTMRVPMNHQITTSVNA